MSTYYAINLYDPDDKVELKSNTTEEAEKEIEQLQGYRLLVICPSKPYSHLLTIAFEVESYYDEDNIPIEEIRHALLERICYLDNELLQGRDNWNEAVDLA